MTSSLIARGAPKRTPVFHRRARGVRHGLNYEARAPIAGLTQAGDGTFYGTTSAGGAAACGTAFTITGTGSLTTLHSSASVIAGRWPSGLIPPGMPNATARPTTSMSPGSKEAGSSRWAGDRPIPNASHRPDLASGAVH
jgi:uncharacterized repeat protein (TIGR03803 family)